MLLFALGEAFRSGVHKAMIFEYLRLQGWEEQKVRYYGLHAVPRRPVRLYLQSWLP